VGAAASCAPARTGAAPHRRVRRRAGARGGSRYPPLAPLGDDVFARRYDRLRSSRASRRHGGVRQQRDDVVRVPRRRARVRAQRAPDRRCSCRWTLTRSWSRRRSRSSAMKRQTRIRAVKPWEEQQSPYGVVRDALGAADERILIEPTRSYQAAQAWPRAPGGTLVDGTAAFERLPRFTRTPTMLARSGAPRGDQATSRPRFRRAPARRARPRRSPRRSRRVQAGRL